MLRLIAILALGTLVAIPPGLPAPPALAQVQAFPIAEMMRATALDEIFSQFGASIAASARTEDISGDEIFLKHWEATAAAVFDPNVLHQRLAVALDGKFSAEEQDALGVFFRSAFGQRITALERDAARLTPDEQAKAVAAGHLLSEEAGMVRGLQLDELMQLVGAEISAAMVGQSVRALLMGMSVSHQQGEVQIPWEEIDAQVSAMMPQLTSDVSRTQRALMAFAYRDLSNEELGRYINFLRTKPAQRFYALAAYAVGSIVTDGMAHFGEVLARRMKRVNI